MATKLDLADAQFIGFKHGKHYGSNVIALVVAMGLTEREWRTWKQTYAQSLDEEDINEIDIFFSPLKTERR